MDSRRFLLTSYLKDVNMVDAITIAAFINVGKMSIFKNKFDYSKAYIKTDTEIYINEFILCLEIWKEYQIEVNKTIKGKPNIAAIQEWAEKKQLKFLGLLDVSNTRDEIMDTLFTERIDIYKNTPLDEIANPKLNNLLYNDLLYKQLNKALTTSFYLNQIKKVKNKHIHKHLSININNPILEKAIISPKYLLTSSISFIKKKSSTTYEYVNTGFVMTPLLDYLDINLLIY